MSTDIKPGDCTCGTCAALYATPTPHTDHIEQQPGGCGAGCFDDAAAEYRAAETAPHDPYAALCDETSKRAPLDPALVKAGDTVTLSIKLSGQQPFTVTGPTYRYGEGGMRAGGWPISNHPSVTLTAHQPAPEPEPEWDHGMLAVVMPHGKDDLTTRAIYGEDGTWHNTYGGFWSSDEVAIRPLVVIDPAAVDVDALAKVIRDAVEMNPTIWKHAAFEALAHLGIEVAR